MISLCAKDLFEQIGADERPAVFLVGVAKPDVDVMHPVCIEPETGPWPPAIFAGLNERIEAAIVAHPEQMMFYGDDATMRDKPENIRRLVISEEILRSLQSAPGSNAVRNFVSRGRPVGHYYVAVVLQVSETLMQKFPAIVYRWMNEDVEGSFLLSCIRMLMDEAETALGVSQPGRFSHSDIRTTDEIVRQAASRFMRIPFVDGEIAYVDMFKALNDISKLMYENAKGRGRIILAKDGDPHVDYVLKFARSVPVRDTRWVRKLLQMAGGDAALVLGTNAISGLGRISKASAQTYSADFIDQQHWDFKRGEQILLRTRFGVPTLPQEPISNARFENNFKRIFPTASQQAAGRFRAILDDLLQMPHGSMLMIAQDAEAEALRLERQGTRIDPVALNRALIEQASRIDGTILADPEGVCHAIGVILDGSANDECTPSRGSRYNSAVRYVHEGAGSRLAFVVSDDQTLDIIPLLRIRMSQTKLEAAVQALEVATVNDFHQTRNFLFDHQFYLSEDQCARINVAMERLDELAMKDGQIVLKRGPFVPHPMMTNEYFDA